MPTKRDNDEERYARINKMVEDEREAIEKREAHAHHVAVTKKTDDAESMAPPHSEPPRAK